VNSMWSTKTQPDVSDHTEAQPDTHTTPPRHSCKIGSPHSKAIIHPPAHTYLSTPEHSTHSPTWTHKPPGYGSPTDLCLPISTGGLTLSASSHTKPVVSVVWLVVGLVVCGSKWVSEWNAQVWTSKCVLVDE
jgi:hypothetical protein